MKWLLHDNEKENLFCSDFHYKCSLLNSFTLIITSAFSPSDSKEWSPFITHIRINVRLQAWNKGERNVNVNHRLRALFSLSSGRLLYQEKIDQHLFHVIFKKMYLINYILVSRRKKSHNYGHNEPLLKRKEKKTKKIIKLTLTEKHYVHKQGYDGQIHQGYRLVTSPLLPHCSVHSLAITDGPVK